MICPKCGSEHVQKKGFRAGKQRFHCMTCNATFTEGVKYKKKEKYIPIDESIICPSCGSSHIRRDGRTGSYQRYECYDCRKNFSDYTIIRELNKIPYKCPYCGGELVYGGYGRKGQRKYLCKECGRSCSASETGEPKAHVTFSQINKEIKCPECSSLNINLKGSAKGRKKYACGDCGKTFLEDVEGKRYTDVNRNHAIELIQKGKNLESVAEECGYTRDYLRKITKNSRMSCAVSDVLKGINISKVAQKHAVSLPDLRNAVEPEYLKETVTKEQKEMIIKFGVHLNVPLDYLAEYIPCSEHKCVEVMEAYRKKLKL